MAAPLAVYTEKEQRFLWSETEINWMLLTQYGYNVLLCESVYEWIIEKFKSEQTSMAHKERAGCPLTSNTDEKIWQA